MFEKNSLLNSPDESKDVILMPELKSELELKPGGLCPFCAFFLICRFLGLFKSRLTSLKRAIHSNLQLQLIFSCQKISSLVSSQTELNNVTIIVSDDSSLSNIFLMVILRTLLLMIMMLLVMTIPSRMSSHS